MNKILSWAFGALFSTGFSISFLYLSTSSAYSQRNLEGEEFPSLSLQIPQTNQQPINTQAKVSQFLNNQKKLNTSIKSSDIPKVLGNQKRAIAQWYKIPEAEFDKKCQNDKCVKIDQKGRLFHACAGLSLNEEQAHELIKREESIASESFNYNIEPDMAFELQSMPNAQRTIYLDFDGHITKGTFWNNAQNPEIIHPAMDLDNTPNSFTENEKRSIIKIWKQVCEDFAPYAVNVTTKEPPLDKLMKTNNADQEYGIRVVIGGNGRNFLPASYGGIAYVGSFSWANDTPTFAFSDNLGRFPKYIAEVISHEVGHTAGLWHHGRTDGTTYHGGDGTWAPIMGVAYGARVGQWSKGEYPLANNKNPDMETMAQYMPFKEDVESKPTQNPTLGEPLYGTIHRPNEVDSFFLNLKGGQITIKVELPEFYPNTDLSMNLKDENGNIVSTHKYYPLQFKSINVKEGRYTLELFGSPFTGAGNSSYGSTGEYKITITQDTVHPSITNAEIIQNGEKLVTSLIRFEGGNQAPDISYQWQIASYNSPNNFHTLEGQTNQNLTIDKTVMLGKYVRAIVTPSTGGFTNSPFVTHPIRILSQTPKEVKVNEYIEFSSNLELPKDTELNSPLMINEISKGHSFGGNPEWIELVTLYEVDLRGYKLKTKFSEELEFANNPKWANVPEGTIITIYNGLEKDPLIGPDKFLPKSERLVIAGSTDESLFKGKWAKLKGPKGIASVNTGFENSTKPSYIKQTINIDGVNWVLEDTLIGNDARDMKEGLASLRLRNGYIETENYLAGGIKEVSFLYARANFAGDRTGTAPSFQVWYSPIETPGQWIPIASNIAVYNDTLTKFSAVVNYDGEYKIKIGKVAGSKDKRWNIDELKITASETMNFIKIIDSKNALIRELIFGYNKKSIKNGFLLDGITESFSSKNLGELDNPERWLASPWSKNNDKITPGKANNPDNRALIEGLSSYGQGTMPYYTLEDAPPGLKINKDTGKVEGSINKPGYYILRKTVSNGIIINYETSAILVRSSFEEAFKEYPQIAENPKGDFDKDGIPNIIEFGLGEGANKTTEILTLDYLNNLSKAATPTTLITKSNSNEVSQALTIRYKRNKTALGVMLTPKWSTDMKEWKKEGITTQVLRDLGEYEEVISWIPLPPSNQQPTDPETHWDSNKLFMTIEVVKE